MCMVCVVTYATVGTGLLVSTPVTPVNTASQTQTLSSQVVKAQQTPTVVSAFKMPSVAEPQWLKDQNAAEQAAAAAAPATPAPYKTRGSSSR